MITSDLLIMYEYLRCSFCLNESSLLQYGPFRFSRVGGKIGRVVPHLRMIAVWSTIPTIALVVVATVVRARPAVLAEYRIELVCSEAEVHQRDCVMCIDQDGRFHGRPRVRHLD